MGCGLLSTVLARQAGLTDVDGAAIVEPMMASLKMTEMMVDLQKGGMPFVAASQPTPMYRAKNMSEVLASRR